ncbi:MAG: sterol desaturase family protein, partial [Bdellovibrionota bacterium]
PVRVAISFLILDYTLFVVHYLNHRIPFLWRFHLVHHADMDMDVTTSIRFHFGELACSSFFRVGFIFIFGIDVWTLLFFEACITGFAMFNHANLNLPSRLDGWLTRVLVTPRMHGIHHSVVTEETNSNYGTIFTIWDMLHRSLKLGIPQSGIVIGVPSHRKPEEQNLAADLMLPFRPTARVKTD